MADDGTFKHNGTVHGYLYLIDEEVKAEDVYPHPHPINASKWEWLTKRELKNGSWNAPPYAKPNA